MVVAYSKKHLRYYLFLGLLWLGLFVVQFFSNDIISWINSCFLSMALVYLGTYFYRSKYKYLTIENNYIKENKSFGTIINFSEITSIKKFAGDYIIKTENSELIVYKELVARENITDLENELDILIKEFNQQSILL